VTEAGNLIDLGYHLLSDKDWAQKDKHILGTPFSQYLKLETDFRKTWQLGDNACAVFHFYGGIMKPLGNDNCGPFSEQMYIGGANDLRGVAMRTVGPGAVHIDDSNSQYLYHNGDLKLVMNIEYRPRLFGSFYGALFVDAGNVWVIDKDRRNTMKEEFQQDSFKKDIALNVGVGLRYDLDFFVLRLDWGFALHQPYSNYYSVKDKQLYSNTSGFFNVRNFKDAQCINFAIGYPF
jgi:outer membrane protein assembly factor BamA